MVLTDQTTMAGIGNAWSDEILHRAKLTPFVAANQVDTIQVGALYQAVQEVLAEVREALANVPLEGIKATKKPLFSVHDRAGQVCPVCGATVAEVSYVDRSMQYCPSCQTGGKKLSDRRMDRLLK
ncbi:zinc finger domain-containing protein [Kocuria sp. cx-116]|uniref:zinc finger domain-containing protein n=1 Tax=Kocuria sp. cx-116 TaxID=2771378 RepID=UPI001CC22A95|nr:zinc finger domain-containing protein [Kocuria sp. cx-116]